MDPINLFDMAMPNFNEMCLITMGLVAVFLLGLFIMDGIGQLWMRITGRDKE